MAFNHAHVAFGGRQWFSSPFNNSSPRGDYGNAMAELDYVVGKILAQLEYLQLLENTLIIFTSDNGPWKLQLLNGGSGGLFTDGKGSTWEGGIHMPALAMWQGVIQAQSVSQDLLNTMDVFTTILSLAGVRPPSDRVIDGLDVTASLLGDQGDKQTKSPHDYMFFWNGRPGQYYLCAVLNDTYKIHYITGSWYDWDARVVHDPPLLYQIEKDPSELYPLNTTLYQDVIQQFSVAVTLHKKGMVFAEDQCGRGSDPSLAICCNRATNCVCGQDIPSLDDIVSV
eukprot:TRINITY_DN4667_c0_g1_i3.p2 TRINITY_DN4667_c0_g1~~TRINITY_DN4667_c0_g1_i3.p2  ORF type:complete len:282 (+),score=59.77 TRINITY_DN4667_c0_g1_i3:737-1582(+)